MAGRPCRGWIQEYTEENLLAGPGLCGARLEAGSMREVWLDLLRADPPRGGCEPGGRDGDYFGTVREEDGCGTG